MDRLTRKKYGELLIKYNDGECRSPCFGCESINKCKPEKVTCGFYKALEKLAEYEDLEEQGKLLKLPYAVGDTVYYIAPKRRNYEELKVMFFNVFSEDEIYMRCDSVKSPHMSYGEIDVDEIGKTVFLTRKEAEAALKELQTPGRT